MEDKVIVTLKGKPIITQKDLEREKEHWSQDPQLQDFEDDSESYLKSEAFVRNCLNGLIKDKIAEEYVLANKINETADYQERLKGLVAALHKKIFYDSVKVLVSEDEVEAEYAVGYSERYPTRTYKEARENIIAYLKRIHFRDYLNEKIEELKKEFDVEIHDDLVK